MTAQLPAPMPVESAQTMLDLADLYRQHRPYVRACLLSCRVPDASLDDAIQDVFVVLFRRQGDFDRGRGTLRAWLFGISFRVARQHRRKVGRPSLCPDTLEADDAVADPESYASRLRAAELAAEMLDTLPREQLSVLVLSDIEGMQGPEIAAALQLQLGTVHSRLSRARKRLAVERQRRRRDEGMEARPWFALLGLRARDLFATRPGLRTAAFVSVQTLRAMLVVLGIAVVAAVVLWLGREPATDDTSSTKAAAVGLNADAAGDATAPKRSATKPLGHPPLPTTSSISGTVSNEAHRGLGGATVCAWLENEDLLVGETRLPRCTNADGSGRYRIDQLLPSRYRVTAAAPRMLPGQFTTSGDIAHFALRRDEQRTGVDIVLATGGVEIRGVVSDVTGGPVAEAVVMSRSPGYPNPMLDGTWGAMPPSLSRTDDEGAFTMWVVPGDLELEATADGYARARSVVVAPGLTATLVMTPESVIAGRVIDRATGDPVAGARVSVGGRGPDRRNVRHARSDDQGRYRLVGLEPGRYRPQASAPGRLGDAASSVELGLGQSIEDIAVDMIVAPSITGRFVVDGDRACTTGLVALQGRGNGQTFASRADHDGVVHIEAILPDEYDVVAACHGFALAEPAAPIAVGDSDVTGVEWALASGHAITGRVVDHSGAAVAEASISAFGTGPGASDIPMSARTSGDGTFEIRGAVPGRYAVTASRDGAGAGGRGNVEIDDADVDVELELPAVAAIEGRVVDEAGEPQAGVTVHLRKPFMSTVSTDDGTFALSGVPAGTHSVTAQREAGDESTATDVAVTAGRNGNVELVLPSRDATITGTVVGEDGDAVRDAIVTALPDRIMEARGRSGAMRQLRNLAGFGRGRAPTLTDANGHFEMAVHAGESFTVLAQRRGGGDAWQSGVDVGSEVTLDIPARASVSGTITTDDGAAATALTIRLRNTDSGAVLEEGFAYSEGAFRFNDLGAGPYELVAVAKEGRVRAEFELSAGQDHDDLSLQLVGGVTVRGRVVDVTTGKPVEGMTVVMGPPSDDINAFAANAERAVVFSKKGHRTDAEGRFALEDIPPGAVRVMVLSEKMGEGPYGMAMFAVATVGIAADAEEQEIAIAPMPAGPNGKYVDLGLALTLAKPWCADTPVVGKVAPGTPAAAAGLKQGDRVLAVGGHDVTDERCHLANRLVLVESGDSIELTLAGDRTVTVTAP